MMFLRRLVCAAFFLCGFFVFIRMSGGPSSAVAVSDAVDRSRMEKPSIKALSEALSHYLMGGVYDNFGAVNLAVGEYEKAMSAKGDVVDIRIRLAADLDTVGKTDKAIELLTEAVNLEPGRIRPYILLAVISISRGEYDNAIKWYEAALEQDNENLEVLAFYSDFLIRRREFDKASVLFKRVLGKEPSDSRAYLMSFDMYMAAGMMSEAEGALKEAVSKGADDAAVYASFGYLDGQKKDDKNAIRNYEKAVEKDPANDTYKFYLAAALDRVGEKEKAVKMMEGLAESGTEITELYNYLGYTYAEEGKNLDRAIELVKIALAKDPENGAYLDSLAWAYYKKGLLAEALEEALRAVQFMPDDGVIKGHLEEIQGKIKNTQ